MYFEKNINKDSLTSESSMINPSRVSTHENLNTIQLSAAMNEYWTILTFAAQKDFPN